MVYPYSAHEVRNASETVQRNRQKYSFSMVFDETEPQILSIKVHAIFTSILNYIHQKACVFVSLMRDGGTVHFGTC